MLNKSNLDSIKEVATSFLYQNITETEYSPIVIMHPIFETGFTAIKVNDEIKMANILENENDLRIAQKDIENRIKSQSDIHGVYMCIRKSYRLTFIKYIKNYLSKEDLSELLAHAWVSSENPNDDANVPIKMAVKWFRQCDKSILMDKDEYEIYCSLPDKLEVYRGVAVGRKAYGLSWTNDLDKAKWFAHRFDRNGKEGYVQSVVVDKHNILAYFDTRDEREIVVDTTNINLNEIKVI